MNSKRKAYFDLEPTHKFEKILQWIWKRAWRSGLCY